MTVMHTELYNALIDAGASDDKARAAAETAVSLPVGETPATSHDIARLENRVKGVENAILRLDDRLWKIACAGFALGGAIILLLGKIAFFP